MRVLIIGSKNYENAPEEELFKAASQLGVELTKRGHTILIGTDIKTTVDYHFFKGAKEETGKISNIEIHRPDDGVVPFAAEFQIPENDINIKYHPFEDWQPVHMETMKDADALLVLGGSSRSVIVGTAGNMLNKAVIPVGSFGGGAKILWSYGSSKRLHFYGDGVNDSEIDRLAAPWRGQDSARHAVDLLENVHKAKVRVSKLSTPTRVLFIVFLVLIFGMAAWVALLAKGQSLTIGRFTLSGVGLLFILVCFAGIWGSAMKSVLDYRKGNTLTYRDILVDLVSGIGAGVISSILYLTLELAITGKVNNPQELDGYLRISLLVSLLAVFTAMYIDTALARFESVRESVLLGEFGKSAPHDRQ